MKKYIISALLCINTAFLQTTNEGDITSDLNVLNPSSSTSGHQKYSEQLHQYENPTELLINENLKTPNTSTRLIFNQRARNRQGEALVQSLKENADTTAILARIAKQKQEQERKEEEQRRQQEARIQDEIHQINISRITGVIGATAAAGMILVLRHKLLDLITYAFSQSHQ